MEGYGFPPHLAPRAGRAGWWPTADVGSLDASGYLTLAGRADDCFKTAAGYLVSPGEITQALADYNKSISINPRLAMAYYGRGLAFYASGRCDKAR